MNLRSLKRTLHLARIYPRAFLAWFLKPFLSEARSFDALAAREEARARGEKVGWLNGDKIFKLFGLIPLFTLPEGVETSAHHFYFARPAKPMADAFRASGLSLFKGARVFEPGCGCGKNLYYFQDRFGVQISGVDIYAPAIEVAQKANIYGDADFRCLDVVSEGLKYIPDRWYDLVLVNSYFAHIVHLPGFGDHLDELARIGKNIVVYEKDKEPVRLALEAKGFRRLAGPKLLMVK